MSQKRQKGPSKPVVGRPRTFDRDHVVQVAVESYWRDGVENVSLNEICRRAAVAKPGVYREFGGEDGLMDAALEHYAATVLAPNFNLAAGTVGFAELLDAMIELMTDSERTGPPGCLLAKVQHSPQRLGPLTLARAAKLRDSARLAYGEWVDQAKVRGELPEDLSTVVAAALIDIQCTNLLVQMSLGEDPDLLRAQARLAFAGLT